MEYQGKTIFSTKFENQSDKPVRILENGKVFFRLASGEHVTKHAIDPAKTYAPFSRVLYLKNGEVEVKKNSEWTPPAWWGDALVTEFLNLTKVEVQGIRVNGELVDVYRHIPRYTPITQLNSEFALVAKAVWQDVTRKEPDPATRGLYMRAVTVTEMVKVPRPNGQLREIEKRLRDQAEAQAKKEVDAKMKRLMEQSQ